MSTAMDKDGYSGTIQEPVFNILKAWTSVPTFHRVQWVLSTPRLAAGDTEVQTSHSPLLQVALNSKD